MCWHVETVFSNVKFSYLKWRTFIMELFRLKICSYFYIGMITGLSFSNLHNFSVWLIVNHYLPQPSDTLTIRVCKLSTFPPPFFFDKVESSLIPFCWILCLPPKSQSSSEVESRKRIGRTLLVRGLKVYREGVK